MGDGTKIRTFDDIWTPGLGQLWDHLLLNISQPILSQVDRLTSRLPWRVQHKKWNIPLLSFLWPEEVVGEIAQEIRTSWVLQL